MSQTGQESTATGTTPLPGQPRSTTPHGSSGGGGSPAAFALGCMACLVAVIFPTIDLHQLSAILAILLGGSFLFLPPRFALPRWCWWLAGAFALAALSAFLPSGWAAVPEWRAGVEKEGLNLGRLITAHPRQTFEHWIGLLVVILTGLFWLGHRVGDRSHLRLMLVFSLGVAVYAGLAVYSKESGWQASWDYDPSLGFFPNRNHTATLLTMGTMAALCTLFQSIRMQRHAITGLAATALCLTGGVLLGVSVSRAGFLLLGLALPAWLLALGRRYLSAKMLALLAGCAVAVAALFLYLNEDMLARFSAKPNPPAAVLGEASRQNPERSGELRMPIYRDTWKMIRTEPWTGVGMGMFRFVFPQYRNASATGGQCVHPESDWLMLAAEQGLLSVLLLGAGVLALLVRAVRQALHQPCWALRAGGIITAAILPLHGIFDVPGHRVGLALSAILLLALSHRAVPGREKSTAPAARLAWRFAGAGLLCAGVWLGLAGWFGGRPMGLMAPIQLAREAGRLHQEDREAAANPATPPPAPGGEDKLETAISRLDQAIAITPLDPDLHYDKGFLALYFSDMVETADREFALQRLLSPTWIQVPLRQALGWVNASPERTQALWDDALKRTDKMQQLAPGRDYSRAQVLELAAAQASGKEGLMRHLFSLAESEPAAWTAWAAHAPPPLLDELIPVLLGKPDATATPSLRTTLLTTWRSRGDSVKADAWKKEHPAPE